MDELIEFFRARLDEDEQTARRIQAARHGALLVAPGDGESPTVIEISGDRLQREVEAKRRIIEIHKLEVAKDPARFNQLTGEQLPDVYEVNCAVCGWATDDPTSGCETLRLLALPCADRPGYREEWKP